MTSGMLDASATGDQRAEIDSALWTGRTPRVKRKYQTWIIAVEILDALDAQGSPVMAASSNEKAIVP